MFFKAAFKNAPVRIQLLMLLAIIAFCMFFSVFLFRLLIIFKVGFSQEAIIEVQKNLFDFPDIIRGQQFMQMLGIFLLPAIICAWLFSDDYQKYLRIDQPILVPVALWTIISIIVAVPFLNWTYSINQQMVFPEALKGLENWIKEAETSAKQLTTIMLDTNNISTIIFNFLAICVVAAISEEFMFRGLLQTTFGKVIRNPHVLIWIIAILFSALHFQFYGFITRMLLGAWLGYLVYFTKTIWIPVLAHFTNNLVSVAGYYLLRNTPDKMELIDTIGTGPTWWLSFASFALFFFCFAQIKKKAEQ